MILCSFEDKMCDMRQTIFMSAMLLSLYAAVVAALSDNAILSFASIPTTATNKHHPSHHNMGHQPFCAEATCINNDNASSCKVHISRLEDFKVDDKLGYDVSSARGWMEYIENCEGKMYGVGAYTVLRCDATYSKKSCHWKIWGIGFHMNRLCSSYRMLLRDWGILHAAESYTSKMKTNTVITSLLDEAATSLLQEILTKQSSDKDGEQFTRTLMVTILWTLPRANSNGSDDKTKELKSAKPMIRGHAAFAGAVRAQKSNENNTDLFPSPISACLAIPSDPTPEELAMLPRRFDSEKELVGGANAKISSWCRIRRPLEDPTRFKVPEHGVGEVLLVTQDKSKPNINQQGFIESLNILEGLTSNFFVIYKDGTVQTAPVGKVLLGYARHLVKDAVNERKDLNLNLNAHPTIQDAKDGLWSEVFITSAIRLIVPVNRVLMPPIGDDEEPVILWQSSRGEPSGHPLTRSIWTLIKQRGSRSATSYPSDEEK